MNYSSIREQIKESWIKDIQNEDNIETLDYLSKNYITILNSLCNIQSKSRNTLDTNTEQKNKNVDEDVCTIEDSNIYIFQRRLKGGIAIPKSKKEQEIVLVPETIIRDQDLNSGDNIKIDKHALGNNKHSFTKIENMEKAEPDNYPMIAYNNSVVSFDETLKSYIIKSHYKSDGLHTIPTLIINDEDITRYQIEDGDIVDVAHMTDRSSVKIRWKYSSKETPYHKPQKSSTYKDTRSNETIDSSLANSPISNRTIGIIGGSTYINGYIAEVKQRNGKVITTEAVQKAQIENLVNKSDIVVIPIFDVGHIKMDIAKASCKKKDKPFVILRSNGRSTFVQTVEQHLISVED